EIRKSNMEDNEIKYKMNEKIRNVSKLCKMEIRVKFEENETVKSTQEKIETIQKYKKIIYKTRKLENEITHRRK
ncbi:13069_t:CDS:1, partial [Gigaspora margarita]